MNILRRLKKLEVEIIDDSKICRCNGDQPQIEIRRENVFYNPYESGKYIPYQNRPNKDKSDAAGKDGLTPENCLQCKKPVNKQVIVLQLIDTGIE